MITESMRIDPAYRERLRVCGLDTVDKVVTRVDGRVVAWSRTTDTLHVPGPDGAPGFYVKRHFYPGWTKRLRGTFRGTFFGTSRARREFAALSKMRALGIPAVRAVAYGGRRAAHFLMACFLITEEVPDAVNLTTFAQEVHDGRRSLDRSGRRALADALADQLAEIHATGFAHGNAFWRNVLIRTGPGDVPEFFLLDVQARPLWGRPRPRRATWLRELAQTTVSALPFTTRMDRLRFAHRYLDALGVSHQREAALREVERQAKTWQRHELRRIHMNRLFEQWNRELEREQDARTALEGGPPA